MQFFRLLFIYLALTLLYLVYLSQAQLCSYSPNDIWADIDLSTHWLMQYLLDISNQTSTSTITSRTSQIPSTQSAFDRIHSTTSATSKLNFSINPTSQYTSDELFERQNQVKLQIFQHSKTLPTLFTSQEIESLQSLTEWFIHANLTHMWYTSVKDVSVKEPFIFFHQRKSGGSSIRETLYHSAKELHLPSSIACYDNIPCETYDLTNDKQSYAIYGGHYKWGVQQDLIKINDFSCVTNFRNPINRIESCLYFRFAIRLQNRCLNELSLEEFAKVLYWIDEEGQSCLNEPFRVLSGDHSEANIDGMMAGRVHSAAWIDDNLIATASNKDGRKLRRRLDINTNVLNIFNATLQHSLRCTPLLLEEPISYDMLSLRIPMLGQHHAFNAEQYTNFNIHRYKCPSLDVKKKRLVEEHATLEKVLYDLIAFKVREPVEQSIMLQFLSRCHRHGKVQLSNAALGYPREAKTVPLLIVDEGLPLHHTSASLEFAGGISLASLEEVDTPNMQLDASVILLSSHSFITFQRENKVMFSLPHYRSRRKLIYLNQLLPSAVIMTRDPFFMLWKEVFQYPSKLSPALSSSELLGLWSEWLAQHNRNISSMPTPSIGVSIGSSLTTSLRQRTRRQLQQVDDSHASPKQSKFNRKKHIHSKKKRTLQPSIALTMYPSEQPISPTESPVPPTQAPSSQPIIPSPSPTILQEPIASSVPLVLAETISTKASTPKQLEPEPSKSVPEEIRLPPELKDSRSHKKSVTAAVATSTGFDRKSTRQAGRGAVRTRQQSRSNPQQQAVSSTKTEEVKAPSLHTFEKQEEALEVLWRGRKGEEELFYQSQYQFFVSRSMYKSLFHHHFTMSTSAKQLNASFGQDDWYPAQRYSFVSYHAVLQSRFEALLRYMNHSDSSRSSDADILKTMFSHLGVSSIDTKSARWHCSLAWTPATNPVIYHELQDMLHFYQQYPDVLSAIRHFLHEHFTETLGLQTTQLHFFFPLELPVKQR